MLKISTYPPQVGVHKHKEGYFIFFMSTTAGVGFLILNNTLPQVGEGYFILITISLEEELLMRRSNKLHNMFNFRNNLQHKEKENHYFMHKLVQV